MRLKRLRIRGFKSFGDSVDISFKNRGISVIVGPNGCGKSNVVDAVRWVLGEQSPRLLRGGKMSDIIFSGTTSLPPVGAAEVSIIFSNAERNALKKYNAYHEISITRRLYRSGESEYLINNLPCRLMDIRDLMMDTGAAGRSYSIIEQGRVEAFIIASPEDRRGFMEEAAGVVRYKVQRNQSLRKLEQTGQNLARIEDILHELNRQETVLQEQMQAVLERRGLEQTLQAAERVLHHHKLQHLQRMGNTLKNKQQEITQSLQTQQTRLQTQQTSIQALKLDQERTEHALRENTSALGQEEGKLQRVKAEIALQTQQNQDAERWLAHWQTQITSVQEQQQRLLQDGRDDSSNLQSIAQQLALASAQCQICENAWQLQTKAQQKAQAHFSQIKETLTDLQEQKATLAGQSKTVQQRQQMRTQAQQAQRAHLQQIAQEQQEAQKILESLEQQSLTLAHTQSHAQKTQQSQQTEHAAALASSKQQGQRAKEALRQEMTVRSRREALLQLEARNLHLEKHLGVFLNWTKKNPQQSQSLGILGPLEQWLEASPEILRTSATYLARLANTILIEEAASLPQIQGILTQLKCEGIRFIALQPQPTPLEKMAVQSPVLADSIRLNSVAAPLTQRLFQSIQIHQSLTIPFPYPQPWGAGQEWLGPQGHWQIGPKGEVQLGQNNAPIVQHLERKAELQDLEQSLNHIEQQRKQEEALLLEKQKRVTTLNEVASKTETQLGTLRIEAKQTAKELIKQKQWLAGRQREVERLTQQESDAIQHSQRDGAALTAVEQAIQQTMQQHEALKQDLNRAQSQAQSQAQSLKQCTEALTQARLTQTRLEEQKKLAAQATQKAQQQNEQLKQQ